MSKIQFTRLKAKNFRSIGNMPIELNLNVPNSLICSSENGAGKSTMMTHLLTYALYDKPYGKGQKKSALVNSKSNKDCLVEIDFIKNGSLYTIRRGMKPSVFDILKDGIRIDDIAANSDYQTILQGIIGIDEKVFYNTIVLGKDKFVPFVEMSAGDRRNYIEQVLDLDVFSSMNEVAKEDTKDLKYDLQNTTEQINIVQSRLKTLNENLAVLHMRKEQHQEDCSEQLNAKQLAISDIDSKIESTKAKLAVLYIDNNLDMSYNKLNSRIIAGKTKIEEATNTIHKIKNTTTCPTCKQDISDSTKQTLLGDKEKNLNNMNDLLVKLQSEFDALQVKYNENKEQQTKYRVLSNELDLLNNNRLQLYRELNTLKNNDNNVDNKIINDCMDKINVDNVKLVELKSKELELTNKLNNYNALLRLLKDDGIKAKIVERYIPRLNNTVNAYLDKLGLFVSIIIDNEFNISMYSPTRKGQGIQDLSSGQIRRIDLALLLAWRDIAASRASVDSNILVLDETLENLSAQGVNDFLQFYNSTYNNDDMTLFVVSQRKDEFAEYFDNVIEFGLKDDFTVML